MPISITGLILFFIFLCLAQFVVERAVKDWPKGTGEFPDPKFFYGPGLATAVLLVVMILR